MARLLLLRHAESTWNATGRWQGWADPPLSPAGQAGASRAGQRLQTEPPFDLVVSSDLVRAIQTARLLTDTEPLVEPGLREYDVGRWSGLTREQIEAEWPGDLSRYSEADPPTPPGGEARPAFESRVIEAAARTGERAAAAGAARVLVVAHGGVIRALARNAGRPERHVGHLAGYAGRCTGAGFFPEIPVDLQDSNVPGARYLRQS